MLKKILFIISIFIIGYLFYSGFTTFLQKKWFAANIIINEEITQNNQAIIPQKNATLPKILLKEENGENILKNLGAFVKNPIAETARLLTNSDNGEEVNFPRKIEPPITDPAKTALENYFTETSRIDFPDIKLVSDAITLHKQGESQGLEIIIALLKEKNKELYKITPPPKTEEIHKNSLWIGSKFTEVLEKILKTSGEQEILKIIENAEIKEMQNMTQKTKEEIEILIREYNLDINLQS